MNVSNSLTSEIAYRIKEIYPPVLIAFGVPGNILSIIILLKLRRLQRSTYLVCLSVTDISVLCVSVLPDWIGQIMNLQFRDKYPVVCRLQTFGFYTSLQISSWTLVLVTLERVTSVIYPHRVRILFSTSRIFLSIGITVAFIVSLNTHFLIGKQSNNAADNVTFSNCFTKEYFNSFYFSVWPWIDTVVTFLLPCSCLIVGNILIVLRLRKREAYGVNSVSQTLATEARRAKTSVITRRVITLNVIYIVCMTPACVLAIVSPYCFSDYSRNTNTRGLSELLTAVVTMMMFLNNGVNFLLYIFLGSRFRRELFHVISCA